MSKYLPYVEVHCKDGVLEVYEEGRKEYDTMDQALKVGIAIRNDMLKVDINSDPTICTVERKGA